MKDNYFDALKTKTLKGLENRSKGLAPLNLSKAKRNEPLGIIQSFRGTNVNFSSFYE